MAQTIPSDDELFDVISKEALIDRATLKRLAGGDEIDLLFCHHPRTLEQGEQARGPFAELAIRLRPALVVYAHHHRAHVSAAAGQPALVGLGNFGPGQASAFVLEPLDPQPAISAAAPRVAVAMPRREGKSRRPWGARPRPWREASGPRRGKWRLERFITVAQPNGTRHICGAPSPSCGRSPARPTPLLALIGRRWRGLPPRARIHGGPC